MDLSLEELIFRYEKGNKPIHLLPCDYETDLLAKYNCKDTVKHNEFYMIKVLRDDYISKRLLKVKDDKMALIYGKDHWWGIYPYLRDNGFKIVLGGHRIL